MSVGVVARPFLTRARTGTGALTRVATVGDNLPFARHGQAAVEHSLAASSSRRTPLPSMMRSALCRSWCAKLARYSATQPSALLRRDSNEVSILSSNSRSEDDLLMASASTADSSRSNRPSISKTCFLAALSVNHACASRRAPSRASKSFWPGGLSRTRRSSNALLKAALTMTALHRRRRRISQTMEQMSCTYIRSMIPRGLISRSKASRKASNSSADSVISNGDFGRSASSFLRRIYSPSELPRGPGSRIGEPNVLSHSNESLAEPPLIYPVNRRGRNHRRRGARRPDYGSTGTYLSRSQVKGATRWRNRCRIGGGGCRIASRVQIVCAAWRHSLAPDLAARARKP